MEMTAFRAFRVEKTEDRRYPRSVVERDTTELPAGDVMVDVEGDLTEDSWVWDFGDLKRLTKSIADELDHKFVLQLESRMLTIVEGEDDWEISYEDQRYGFPKSDVAALPIDNSTAERLAEWFAMRLRAALAEHGASNIKRLTVGIEEMPGQAGWYTAE